MKYYEESDYFNIRKDARQERKRISRLDRSKYKKSDQEKQKERAAVKVPSTAKQGIVFSIRPQSFFVESEGKEYICTLKGSLKQERQRVKNLVIVGDLVYFDPESLVIIDVKPRKGALSRADHLSQQKEHFIAANVDMVLITVAVVDPPLRPAIIDRYIIAARKGNLEPVIVCNKADLLKEHPEATALLDECQKIYTSIGIDFLLVSTVTGDGLDLLEKKMKDRISVFSGQSGTGKSSLINALTGRSLKVGKTVAHTKKGSHTTSYAQLLPLDFGGWCIDTPGIKSFGVWDLQEEDLRVFFTEIGAMGAKCKFQDCRHRTEPDCAVRQAVDSGIISPIRYASYCNLLDEIRQEHLRR
jgi:ribosome biogenesis GTPase